MSDRAEPGLVGRERELAQLDAALEGALAGRGELVLLTGEPGIGKTAIARAFAAGAVGRGAGLAWGSCWEGGGAPAYWPWVQIARALTRGADLDGLRDALGAGAPWIAGLLPGLADALGAPAPPPSELDSDQARFRRFDALATLLAHAAEQRPLVVVLDDLHWADASSLLALEFVARALPDMPLLVIAAYRHAEAHARPELAAALGGLARAATRLPLEGLGLDEVGLLAAACAHELGADEPAEIPPRLVVAVHGASAGNPFFVDELVQLLAAQGRLHDDRAADRPLPLPDGVRDAIRRRLAPLGAETGEALAAAAVLGSEVRFQTLAAVLGVPAATVLARLEAPLRAGIVVAGRDPGRFLFAHALVRDTLLEGLSPTRRAQLHRAAGETLEASYGDDVEPHLDEIAHHFLQGAPDGGAERAVAYAARAAQRAIDQFAYEDAARLYARARDVAASLPADDARSWQLCQGLGEARMRAGDVEGAQQALHAAAEHARRLGDGVRIAQSALARSAGAFSPGLVEPELVAALEEGLARIDRLAPADPLDRATVDGLRCRLRVQLALALYWSPQRARRERLVDDALALARELVARASAAGTPAIRTLADRTLAFALAQGFVAVWGPDTVPYGLPISVEALELCARTNDAELAMQVRLWRTGLLLELDDRVRAEEEIEAFGASARRLRQPRMLAFAPLHAAMAACMRGDFDRAERLTAAAAAQARGIPGSIAPIVADAQNYLVRRTQGRHLDLEPLVRGHADRLPAMSRWRCALALLLAELGREDEARRELEQLAAGDFEDFPRDVLWLVAMSLLAELVALLGDSRRARRLYDLLIPYEGRNIVSLGAAYIGPVDRYLGLLARTAGADERALGHLETARSAAERMGARPVAVLTALDAAEVLARRRAPGDAARGRALVERVAGEAARMRMAGAVGHADDLRARLAEPADDDRLDPRGLRPLRAALRRQQDVWLLEYEGRTVCLQDVKGLHHLAALLASPGSPISARTLAEAVDGGGRSECPRAARERRAGELREELDEALAFNDPERVAAARDELEAIAAQLELVDAAAGADGERARVNVTRAIRSALQRIAEHEPELATIVGGALRTGSMCSYDPDPGLGPGWEIHR